MYKNISDIGKENENKAEEKAPERQNPATDHMVRIFSDALASSLEKKREREADSEASEDEEDSEDDEDIPEDEWDTMITLVNSHLELCRSFSLLLRRGA